MAHKWLLKDMIVPSDVKYEKNSYGNTYGKFMIYPFDRGVGVTIANSLRRVLLSSIPGYAIVSIKISGVEHELDVIPGVKEDLNDIILALKKVKLCLTDGSDKKIIHIEKQGEGVFLAGDLEVDPTIQIVNKDLHIATLNEDADFIMDLQVEFGRGYRSSEDMINSMSVISEIPIDAIFSPILKVNYLIEDYRVGDKTNCEKIVFEVWTDGTIEPIDAMSDASYILQKYFSMLIEFDADVDIEELEEEESGEDIDNDILSKSIDELELSVRSYNCLKSANISTVGELLEYDKNALLNIKNFGKKSLTEISDKLAQYGLTLKGMDEE